MDARKASPGQRPSQSASDFCLFILPHFSVLPLQVPCEKRRSPCRSEAWPSLALPLPWGQFCSSRANTVSPVRSPPDRLQSARRDDWSQGSFLFFDLCSVQTEKLKVQRRRLNCTRLHQEATGSSWPSPTFPVTKQE